MNKQKEAVIDVDAAIEFHNKNNPDNQINKVILAKNLGVNVQNLSNYNAGKTPKVMNTIFNIHLFTGYPIEKLIKEK